MTADGDTKTTPEKRAKFLALLSVYGNVSKAAKTAKLNRTALYDYAADNPDFKVEWERAAELGAQALEDEAKRRAYEGTLRPVFYKGEKCGSVREYSDTLLICLLKAHFPEKYRENVSMDVKGEVDVACLEKGRDRARSRLQ